MIGMALGFVGAGVRAGRFMVGVSLLPARTAWDAAWPRLQARGEAAFDDALAGPLTEHLARSLGEHRVIERIADELIAKGTVTSLFDQALQAGLAEQIADRLLVRCGPPSPSRPRGWPTRWSPACASAPSRWTTSRSARCGAGCAGRAR